MTIQHQALVIRELVLPVSIGVYPREREAPQPLRVDLEVSLQRELSPQVDALEEVLDYDQILAAIQSLTQERHIQLVETLAQEIVEALFCFPEVTGVRLRLEKLQAWEQAAGVGYELHCLRDPS